MDNIADWRPRRIPTERGYGVEKTSSSETDSALLNDHALTAHVHPIGRIHGH